MWRTWQAFGLAPHRQEKFQLLTDPQFVDKVYDICGLNLNPPDAAVVLCVDEEAPTAVGNFEFEWVASRPVGRSLP